MTYADPQYIRKHQIKVLFNDKEFELFCAEAERVGLQPGTLARRYILMGIKAIAAGKDLSEHAA